MSHLLIEKIKESLGKSKSEKECGEERLIEVSNTPINSLKITLENVEKGGTNGSVKKIVRKNLPGFQSGDHACHKVAKCLGGTNIQSNLFAGTRRLNVEIMNHIEAGTKEYIIESGDSVDYKVELNQDNLNDRVNSVVITIRPYNRQVLGVKAIIENKL